MAQSGGTSGDPLALGDVLLHLTDEFAEYEAINAFLCKAFTSVMSTNEPQSGELIQGAQYMAEFLQTRVWQLKSNLESARETHLRQAVGGVNR